MEYDNGFLDIFGLGATVQTSLIGTTITIFSKEDPNIYTSADIPAKPPEWDDALYQHLMVGTLAELSNETIKKIVAKKGDTNG